MRGSHTEKGNGTNACQGKRGYTPDNPVRVYWYADNCAGWCSLSPPLVRLGFHPRLLAQLNGSLASLVPP